MVNEEGGRDLELRARLRRRRDKSIVRVIERNRHREAALAAVASQNSSDEDCPELLRYARNDGVSILHTPL
ncbi:MAG: hypothetical protein ACLPPF_08070 [Rhodomicrobium sp.]